MNSESSASLRDQQEQRALVEDAKAQLAAANQRADALRNAYEANEQTLTEYQATLEERAGDSQ